MYPKGRSSQFYLLVIGMAPMKFNLNKMGLRKEIEQNFYLTLDHEDYHFKIIQSQKNKINFLKISCC